MATVQNIEEVLSAIELLGVSAKEVMKDGKVDLTDLAVVMKLATQASVFTKAVEGIDQVIPEAKDIDAEEAKVLVAKLFAVFSAIKAA